MAVLSAAALAGILSILTSIAGLPEVQLEQTLYALDNDGEEDADMWVEEEDGDE